MDLKFITRRGNEIPVDLQIGKPHFPMVVLLPILSGKPGRAPVANLLRWMFHSQGWTTAVVHRPGELFDFQNIVDFEHNMVELLSDHREILPWLKTRVPHMDKICMLGVSLGGIIAAGVACGVPGYVAVCSMMAGGPIANVVMTSKEPGVVRTRKQLVKRMGGDRVTTWRVLSATIKTDAFWMAALRKVPMLQVRTLFDRVVPTLSQDQLRDRLENQSTTHFESFSVPTGHYTVALLLPFIFPRIQAFFFERLRTRSDA